MAHDVGAGGGGSAPLREVSLPTLPAWPAADGADLKAMCFAVANGPRDGTLVRVLPGVRCPGCTGSPSPARPLPLGWFQVQETVLSPTPLLLLPFTVGARPGPYGLTVFEAGLASPAVALREETAHTTTAVSVPLGAATTPPPALMLPLPPPDVSRYL